MCVPAGLSHLRAGQGQGTGSDHDGQGFLAVGRVRVNSIRPCGGGIRVQQSGSQSGHDDAWVQGLALGFELGS